MAIRRAHFARILILASSAAVMTVGAASAHAAEKPATGHVALASAHSATTHAPKGGDSGWG